MAILNPKLYGLNLGSMAILNPKLYGLNSGSMAILNPKLYVLKCGQHGRRNPVYFLKVWQSWVGFGSAGGDNFVAWFRPT